MAHSIKILRTVDDAQATCAQIKREGKRLGLVPTMGALHEGHLSLVRAARGQCDVVAASIFVNPLQFSPGEDFNKYPRSFDRDIEMLGREGVALVFAPTPQEMYGDQFGSAAQTASTFVEVPGISDKLEGKTRPGHFRGVATVVSKLFHIVDPEFAFFGQKDAQQVVVIRRMVRDLSMGVRIVVCPIVREADGLAMSSRNAYLDSQHRRAATVLYRGLMRVQTMNDMGEQNAAALAQVGREVIGEEPLARLDYFEVVHPETLDPVAEVTRGALVVTAAYLGSTRLIDNLMLHGTGHSQGPNF